MKIDLTINVGFKWYQKKNVWVKGVLFDSNNILYAEEKILEYFSDIKNKGDFEQRLKSANGFFSVVVKTSNDIFAAVDCIRSHPLFYSEAYQWIGDNPEFLANNNNLKEGLMSKNEFFSTGYVTGNQTIYEGVHQLQAGQYLCITNDVFELNTYYQYLHQDFIDYNELDAKVELDKCVTNAMKRLVDYANGRQLVIPLSGGYDSRLIVLKLKKLRYKNVICFTYGKKNNWEAVISKNVADKLGFKWLFIDYNSIIKKIYHSKKMLEYDKFCFRGVSLPHIQDFFAIHELKKNRFINSDALFVPGHSGDFLAGSHLGDLELENATLSNEQVIQRTLDKHYNLFRMTPKKKSLLANTIDKALIQQPPNGDSSSQLDHWNWRERQSKFIVNACRVYEFFGYEWHCPLWDKELMEYFKKSPIKFRRNRWLYNSYINDLNGCLVVEESTDQGMLILFLIKCKQYIKSKLKHSDLLIAIVRYLNLKSNLLCLDQILTIKEYMALSNSGHNGINGVELFLFNQRHQK
jgi:asparagine synthase (glutamine-hydrolysing)